MEKFNLAPIGVPGSVKSQNGRVMSDRLQPSGWRKVTNCHLVADQSARRGEDSSVSKTRAFCAVKRVGAHLGLKPADMMLLDTLGAFSEHHDWEAGRRPIVWPSNTRLMEQTGTSLSALKRHMRRLSSAGLITFKDSSNGKRWGKRDETGKIKEAYGIDLSPLSARAIEFEELYTELQLQRERVKFLKRQITIFRRRIRSLIDTSLEQSLPGPWAQIASLYDDLMSGLPRNRKDISILEQLLDAIRKLLKQVETTFQEASKSVDNSTNLPVAQAESPQNLNSKGSISDPHIPTTNQLKKVESNRREIGTDVTRSDKISKPDRADKKDGKTNIRDIELNTQKIQVDISTVMGTCPEFSTWAKNIGYSVHNWHDLAKVAGQLGPMIGLSPKSWVHAVSTLGKQAASAAIALIFDKHITGEVTSPSAYLNGMIRKAGAGELHLDRSFHGRLTMGKQSLC